MYLPLTPTTFTPPPAESLAPHSGLEGYPLLPEHAPVTTQPDIPSTGSSKRQRRRRRPWMYQQKSNTQQQQQKKPTLITNCVFSPRPHESLYAERAYLSTSLQIQSDQAIILMQQYAAVEANVQWLGGGKDRRRLKKQLNLLRNKITHTVEQQQTILARLGELYVEIQSRESWSQASYGRRSSAGSSVLSSPLTCGSMSPVAFGLPPLITSFSGSSAEFVQGGYGGDFIASPESSMLYQDSLRFAGDLETVDEIGEEYSDEIDSASESQELDMGPATPGVFESSAVDDIECKVEGDELEGEEFGDVCFDVVQKRRLSLPCLPTVWPET